MAATHLSGQLHVPITEVIHFDAALCKPEYCFLALLILSCNGFNPLKFVQTPLLARDHKCGQKNLLYAAALAKIHLQHRILLLPRQTITSVGQGALFSALLKLLGTMQMNSRFLVVFPSVLRDIFLHCVGFFSFVVLRLVLDSADVGVSVLSLPTVYL